MFYFLPAAGACETVTGYRKTGHIDWFPVAGCRYRL